MQILDRLSDLLPPRTRGCGFNRQPPFAVEAQRRPCRPLLTCGDVSSPRASGMGQGGSRPPLRWRLSSSPPWSCCCGCYGPSLAWPWSVLRLLPFAGAEIVKHLLNRPDCEEPLALIGG